MQPDEYRRMAAVEDSMWYYRALHRHVGRSLARAGLPPDARVLDAGCGTGGLLRRLGAAHPTWRLTGIDVSPLACALARARTPAAVVEGSVAALPFGPAQFDAVVSCDVLCQVEDPGLVVREIHRCLRPGGTVVLTMPAYGWLFSYHDRAVQSRRRSTCREVNAWLRAAGFAVGRSTYWNTLLFPLVVLRRKVLPAPRQPASDVRAYHPLAAALCGGVLALEHAWLAAGGRWPFGTSVLTTARKP